LASRLNPVATAPPYWADACTKLADCSEVMRTLIHRHGKEGLQPRGDPFQTLARSIVGQQISVKAAASVWSRLEGFCAGCVNPPRIAQSTVEDLRGCGLSGRKAEYLQALGGAFVSGRINPPAWLHLPDDAVIADLVKERGIGRWTAEMFLIFNLMRPDVWPLDDIGLLRAVAMHWGSLAQAEGFPVSDRLLKASREEARAVGEVLRPWRSVATWYLWRSLDPVPVAY